MRIQTALDRLKKYQEEMKITRENTKKVHKIIRPRNENYVLRAQIGDIEFLPSDESDNENVQPVSKKIISKKSRNLGNLIRNSKYIDSE
uniref:Putative endonuclease of the XPG family n=1 Tax=Moumouvirus sp. 'Monve' TaxID=1128131 RepID=H2EEE3_9VIRU|nr:putative endonuclease of the XPG family [Moumouvirus Monve]